MSLHEYLCSQSIAAQDQPFYALIMAAMRQADTKNLAALRYIFPDVWDEFEQRYHAPGGALTPAELEAVQRWHERQQDG